MEIKTSYDWWQAAAHISEYCVEIINEADIDKFLQAYEEEDHGTVHSYCQKIWGTVPRGYLDLAKWLVLCDVCSEYWVFED